MANHADNLNDSISRVASLIRGNRWPREDSPAKNQTIREFARQITPQGSKEALEAATALGLHDERVADLSTLGDLAKRAVTRAVEERIHQEVKGQ